VRDADALLTAEELSALMRSTWTWDDRALRRDLSELLIRLDAARLVGARGDAVDAVASAIHAAAHAFASNLVATVLGPKLVADTGNPLRSQFLELATDRAHFGKRAYTTRKAVEAGSADYFATHVDGTGCVAEADWSELITAEGTAGHGAAMRATLLGTEGSGGKLMWTLIDRASTALAAEQVGLIEKAIGVLRDAGDPDDHRVTEVVLAHAAAHALWLRALTDASPEAAAAAHVGCSGAAVRVTTAVAEMCDDDSATAPLVLRALSGSLLFGGPALSHERLLDRLGI